MRYATPKHKYNNIYLNIYGTFCNRLFCITYFWRKSMLSGRFMWYILQQGVNPKIDSVAFRLHCGATTAALLAASAALTTRHLVGNPIDCIHTRSALANIFRHFVEFLYWFDRWRYFKPCLSLVFHNLECRIGIASL